MDLEKLGVNLGHLFRFGFAGGLSLLFAGILYPQEIQSLKDSLGWPLTVYAALSLGALIYAIYRPWFLELLLVRTRIYIHSFIDWLWSHIVKGGKRHTSSLLYIKHLGVRRKDLVFAFRSLRDGFLIYKSPDRVKEIREANAVNHYIYLAGLLFAISGAVSYFELFGPISSNFPDWGWLLLGLGLLGTGLVSDMNLDRSVCDFIQDYPEIEIKKHLQDHGYLS